MLREPGSSTQILCLLPGNTLRATPQQQWTLKAPLFLDISPYESEGVFRKHSACLWSKAQQVFMLCERKALKLEQTICPWHLATTLASMSFSYSSGRVGFVCLVWPFCTCHLHFFHFKAKKRCSSIYLTGFLTRVQSLRCCRTGLLII